MTEADFPLLSLIITIPLLGALLAGSIRNVDVAKQIAFFLSWSSLFLHAVPVYYLMLIKVDFSWLNAMTGFPY